MCTANRAIRGLELPTRSNRIIPLVCLVCLELLVTADHAYGSLYLPREGEPVFISQNYEAPRRWDGPFANTPAEVTYSFVTSSTVTTPAGLGSLTITPVASFMPSGALDEIRAAFGAWSAIANITFTEVTDSGNDYASFGDANIRIGGHAFDGTNGLYAHTVVSVFDTSPLDTMHISWIDFDVAENWAVDSIDGDDSSLDIFQAAAHEVGHAIGLDHVSSTTALMYPFYSEAFTGPQADDIAGAQFLYGAVAIPEPSAFLFGGLVCGVLGVNCVRKYVSSRALSQG